MAGHPDIPARTQGGGSGTGNRGINNGGGEPGPRLGRLAPALLAGALLIASLAGCACRPGYVGPYGGIHPARCVVW